MQGVMLALTLYFGRKYFGLEGIAGAQPAADMLTMILAVHCVKCGNDFA